ncbi:hypothetical protein MHYP_G00084340 [Metynnis hypsauchen]
MFFTIVVLLSLIGNILVLVILGLCENFKSLTNIFILNLALSDLIFTLGLPFWACSYIWSWTFGDFMCKGVNFVFSTGFYSSIVFLVLMSFQRCVAVLHPLSDWNSSQSFVVILILAWMFSFSAALPELLYSKVIADQTDSDATQYGFFSTDQKLDSRKHALLILQVKQFTFPVQIAKVLLCTIQERKMENSEEGENANSTFGNDVSYDSPDVLCQNEALIKAVFTVFPIVLTIVVLLSLIGNVLVLVIFGLFENLKSLTNIFILNLALSDLILTLGLPFRACSYIWSWTFGDFMCRSVNFIFSAGFHSSIVFLMLMSIERYVAMVHPRSDWNRWQRFVFPIIAWVFSFAAASPELLYILTIVVLLILIGNILVLVIVGLYENLKSLTNIFILNLALSDLIFTLGLPFWACSYIWTWTFGDIMCKSVNFIFSSGFHSSIVFLMLMFIECYVAVVHPWSDWNRWQ